MRFRRVLFVLLLLLLVIVIGVIMTIFQLWTTRAMVPLALVVGRVIAEEKLFTPAEAAGMAATDIATMQADARLQVRYLSLYNVPAKDRADCIRVLSGHCNSLSTESDIIKPVVIPGTDNSLVRILLSDYGWTASVWEKLTDEEPYFHVGIEEEVEVEVDQAYGLIGDDGKWRQTEVRKEKQKKKVRKATAIAPWLSPDQAAAKRLAYLVQESHSSCPLVRADWFVWQTCCQAERSPGYYDFLNVKTQKDFEELIGFDAKLVKKSKRTEFLEAVAESGVAQQPRRIRRDNTVGAMGFWRTFDNREAVDKANPLRILDNENFKFDAGEMFGPLPNNFWTFALFASDGNRQDSAPDFIGHDSTTASNDGRIHVGLSCVRCHFPNGGVNPLDAWARNLLQPPLALQSPSADKMRELRQQYMRDLLGPMDDDRKTFARALHEATNMTPKEYATMFGKCFAEYDGGVDLERAATDLGVAPSRLRSALDAQVRATGTTDTVLSTFLRPKEQQKLVKIRQWQEAYALAHVCLKSNEGSKK
jgi:hypothetical protein